MGKYFLFLNNDTEVIEPDWMTAMVCDDSLIQLAGAGTKSIHPGYNAACRCIIRVSVALQGMH